jgi:hypothetical protein
MMSDKTCRTQKKLMSLNCKHQAYGVIRSKLVISDEKKKGYRAYPFLVVSVGIDLVGLVSERERERDLAAFAQH